MDEAHVPVSNAAGASVVRCYERRPQAGQILVCFAHAGGRASFFRGWSAHFPPEIEVWAIQYPGRESKPGEACIDEMGPMAGLITRALLTRLDRPYALFGHSMGASIAFEVARRLESRQQVPELEQLIVSARPSPRIQSGHTGNRHLLDDDALLAHVAGLGAPGAELLADSDIREFVMPFVRADYRLIERYRPALTPVIESGITAFVGGSDRSARLEDVKGWQEATSGPCEVVSFPGNHFYLADDESSVQQAIMRVIGLDGPAAHAATAAHRAGAR